MVHDENSEETLRVLNARVGHLYIDVGVLLKIDHKFLLLLHVSEFVFVNNMRVVEEKVIFTCQFNLDLVDLSRTLCTIQ